MPVYKYKRKNKNKKNNTYEWYFVKCWYTDSNGTLKRKTKRGFEREKDAKDWERKFLSQEHPADEGKKNKTVFFSDLVEKYLQTKKDFRKQNTYRTNKSRIDAWILPYFHDKKVKDITLEDVLDWESYLKNSVNQNGKPLSPSYIHNLVVELSSIFNYAVNIQGLPANPVASATAAGFKAGERVKHIDFWTEEEFKKFLATFTEHDVYYTIFIIMFWTGCRRGEVLALTAADVTADYINIDKTYDVIDGKEVIEKPKTSSGVRQIRITPQLAALIDEYKHTLYNPAASDRLFPVSKSSLSRQFNNHIAAAEGVHRIRLHDLRHSHASYLINHDYNILFVSKRLGHKDITTTLNIYSHPYKEKENEMMKRLSEEWFQ